MAAKKKESKTFYYHGTQIRYHHFDEEIYGITRMSDVCPHSDADKAERTTGASYILDFHSFGHSPSHIQLVPLHEDR